MEKEIIEILKNKNFDKDNYMGIIYILGKNLKAKSKMLQYLKEEKNKTRNDIFTYAFEITNTQFDNIIIE